MKKLPWFLLLLFAGVFTALFYGSDPGLNMGLLNLLCITIGILLQPEILFKRRFLMISTGLVVLGIAMAWHASEWTLLVNLMGLGMLAGALSNPRAISFLYTGFQAIENIPGTFVPIHTPDKQQRMTRKNIFSRTLANYSYFLIPIVILLFFILLYSNGNRVFGNFMQGFWNRVDQLLIFMQRLLPKFDMEWIFLFIAGILLGRYLFQGIRNSLRILGEHLLPKILERRKTKQIKGHRLGLRREFRAGMFLFFTLNILLLVVNIIDIQYVWIGFKWTGQLLREFVHEGTWILILSIFFGAVLVLHFFRGNLNFFRENKWLKIFAQIWIWQNIFLTCSVILRNWHYVEYYGLAYKRIGVFFFCAFIFLVLALVSYKVYKRHSAYTFTRGVFAAVLSVLFFSAPWDWASVIVKYNLAHAGRSFLHFNFLEKMPDRCLPELRLTQQWVDNMKNRQILQKYDYEGIEFDGKDYEVNIEKRIVEFMAAHPRKNAMEWTWAEENAYNKLVRK